MPRSKPLAWIVLALCVLSAAEVALFVASTRPPSGFLSGKTPLTFDYSLTTYVIEAGRRFHDSVGRLWGYDPYFGAGYMQAYLEDNLPLLQVVAVALPSVPAGLILLVSNTLLLAALPWLLYGSIRACGGAGRGAALAASLLGLTVLRTGEFSLFPMAGSVLAGFAQVWLLATFAALHLWLGSPSPRRTALLFLLVPLALTIHKSALVLFPPVILAFLIFGVRRSGFSLRRTLAVFAILAAATVALNWSWIQPLLSHLHLRGTWPPPPGVNLDPLRPLRDLLTPSGGMAGWPVTGIWGTLLARDLLIALGALGLVLWARAGAGRPWAPLLGVLSYLFWLTYYASFLRPMRVFEPYRCVIALHLCLLPPAATAIERLLAELSALRPRLPALALVLAAVLAPNALPSYATLDSLRPVRIGLEENLPDLAALAAWIRAHPEPAGRIMIEDAWTPLSGRGESPYLNCYPLTALVLETGRELTASRSPNFRGAERFASFLDGSAFGRPLSVSDDAELARALDLYNVVWVIAWSERSATALDSHPACVRPEATVGAFRIWRAVREKPSFFRVGSGRVARVGFGEIVLEDVEARGGEVVLLYHWMKGLKCEPPAEILPIPLAGDPVPYIRILSPPRSFKVRSS